LKKHGRQGGFFTGDCLSRSTRSFKRGGKLEVAVKIIERARKGTDLEHIEIIAQINLHLFGIITAC
jgi:hypothetical protein